MHNQHIYITVIFRLLFRLGETRESIFNFKSETRKGDLLRGLAACGKRDASAWEDKGRPVGLCSEDDVDARPVRKEQYATFNKLKRGCCSRLTLSKLFTQADTLISLHYDMTALIGHFPVAANVPTPSSDNIVI